MASYFHFRKNVKMKNGQAWGFDLIIALVIFLGGLILFYFYAINFPSTEEDVFRGLKYESELVADSLLSEGSPDNWDLNDIQQIGVVSNGKINESKLEMFYNLALSDYAKSKALFNINDDYYVYFNNPLNIGGELVSGIGMPAQNENNLVRVSRVVVYRNNIISLNVYVWN